MGAPQEGRGFELRRRGTRCSRSEMQRVVYVETQIRSPDAADGHFSASTLFMDDIHQSLCILYRCVRQYPVAQIKDIARPCPIFMEDGLYMPSDLIRSGIEHTGV